MRLTIGGAQVPFTVRSSSARTTPGQAGLPVLRLQCALRAGTDALTGPAEIRLVDTGAGNQVGWNEMTARGDGVTLTRSDVPRWTTSARLTSYPEDLLSSPLDVRSARLQVRPGGAHVGPDTADADGPAGEPRDPGRLTSAFEGLVRHYDGGPLLTLLGIVGAVALGAAHALAPGHGKTIMAFYLSAQRTRGIRAAATVGATVTVTHTAGVLALGLLVGAGTSVAPASAYPWLSVASGLLVVAVGLALLRSARRGVPHSHGTGPGQHTHLPSNQHAHPHHDHDHAHGEHTHHHLREAPAPSARGLVAVGVAGGLVPSPSALLVLLAAVALGHPWFGIGLVLAFGAGMATTLAATGLVVMRLRHRVARRLDRPGSRLAVLTRVAPLGTAGVVCLLGAALAIRGVGAAGVV
jgi:ABC-type nickel/cobalt efflux system permease component RcnA